MLQSESTLSEEAWTHNESPALVFFNLIPMSLLFELSENHAQFNSFQYGLTFQISKPVLRLSGEEETSLEILDMCSVDSSCVYCTQYLCYENMWKKNMLK